MQEKIVPYNINFPIRTSTGSMAKWCPNGVKLFSLSKAPTFCKRIMADSMFPLTGGSKVDSKIKLFYSKKFYSEKKMRKSKDEFLIIIKLIILR